MAALYIDAKGIYPKLPGVECWDLERDARKYDGPHPVVCHPPCGPHGSLKHLYRGSEHDCAWRALEQVRKFGGVLEHPARSGIFDRFVPGYAPWPGDLPDPWRGVTIEVSQVEWGHVARKRTWLYLAGVPRRALEAAPFQGREPTHWISGRKQTEASLALARARGWKGGAAPVGMKICSAQQRRRTPVAFAEYLVRLARAAAANRTSPETIPPSAERTDHEY